MKGRPDKDTFLSLPWVEDRHEYLREHGSKDAKELLGSLSNDEVELNVNCRGFQEAYICDYLEYLWELDRDAFWLHITAAFHHPSGMVISDNPFPLDILCAESLPDSVWEALLDSLFYVPESELEYASAQIIRAQVRSRAHGAQSIARIEGWMEEVEAQGQECAMHRLKAWRDDVGLVLRPAWEVMPLIKHLLDDEPSRGMEGTT